MSVTASLTRSKVVLQRNAAEPILGVAAELLGILGHDVAIVPSADAAIDHDAGPPADLMVLTTADPDACLDRLAARPAVARPRQVVILSENENDTVSLPPRLLAGTKVRVLAKSMHALGLLDLIKRLDTTRN